MDKIERFEIRSPKWTGIFFVVLLFLSLGVGGVLLTLYFLEIVDSSALYVQIFFLFMLLLSVFGLYVYKKEAFLFDGERFTYIKPFKRAQTVALKDLSYVEIKSKILFKVIFYDTQGREAISFLDDGTAFRGNLFLTVLNQLEIPCRFPQ